MTTEELKEKYPFAWEKIGWKKTETWVGLIPDDTEDGTDVSYDELSRVYQNLLDGSACMVAKWGDRTGPNYYKLDSVQKLLNFAIRAQRCIKQMKNDAIEAGVGGYNPMTGKFKIAKKSIDETE
jgi:hypothetical protein